MKKNRNAVKLWRVIAAVLFLAAFVVLQFRLVENKITEKLDSPWVIVISLFLGLLLLAISIKSLFDDMPNGTSGPSPAKKRKYVKQIFILFGVTFLIFGLWNFRSEIPVLKDLGKSRTEIVEENYLPNTEIAPESQTEDLVEEEKVALPPVAMLDDSLENARKIAEDLSVKTQQLADSVEEVFKEKKRARSELDKLYCAIDSLRERQRILADELVNIQRNGIPPSFPCSESPKEKSVEKKSTAKGKSKKKNQTLWNGFTARATDSPQGNH